MSEFTTNDLVVMRTPLLPMEELQGLSRERLQELVARPEIAEAIFLASPDLAASIEQWLRDPDSKKGRRTELGLVRYLVRSASRPTPFGLFAGCTAGRIGSRTSLSLASRSAYRRHSRLDMDYLFALCEQLVRDPRVRAELQFRPNSSLYEAAGRLRFAESRVQGRLRSYHLVAVDAFDALRDTLARAEEGATLDALSAALVDEEITREEADAFLQDLVENQLLVADLALPVTGEESLLPQLAPFPAVHAVLSHAERALASIDAAGVGASTDQYRAIAQTLEPLGVPVELSRLFQVDLTKPASDLILGEPVVEEILRGVDILHRFSRSRFERSLDEFRSAFSERYGPDREVPLLDALDEESGIGFERSGSAGAEASPLLAGLPFASRRGRRQLGWGNTEAALLQILTRGLMDGAMEVALTAEDMKLLENPDRPPIPDAFHAMATLAAASPDAIGRGDYRLLLHSAMGPSGARMLGRFCHADDAIREGVARHVAAEEALRPEAVFAEIVHLPAGRIGNILARPVLRDHEIAFLGRPGVPREKQIALDDLVVTVSGDRIQLRSRTLDREVVPRLSTAHNTMNESLGVYRFLAAMQRAIGMQWDWGPLEVAPFLPRIVSGRIVLSRARWRLAAPEFRPIAEASGAARYELAQQFRATHRMPRYVLLTDGDNELLVDFDNALMLDAVFDVLRKREEIVLTELYPEPAELCASGPEGRFFHELVVPFTRRAATPAVTAPSPRSSIARTFPPGSEWLYAKFYCGTATADRVLCEEIGPLAFEAVASGAARRWFFIRYADPQWHIRVRFHRASPHVRGMLDAAAQRLVESGTVWKVQYDTYEREVERYGGADGIEWCEEIFHRDSEAVIALLSSCSGDAGSDLRWRLMLAGIDALFSDFGLDVPARLRLAESARTSFARQFHYDALRDRLADRFRSARGTLLTGHEVLSLRSSHIAPIAHELRRIDPALTILPSLVHMFVNRLSRSAGPEHELVLYDYLVQLYRSRIARAGKEQRHEQRDRTAAGRIAHV